MNTLNKSFSKFFFVLLFVITISFSISFSSYAQNTTSLGIRGGVNLANFRGDGVKDAENRTAFSIGAVLNYSVAETVGLSLEADYTSLGAVDKGNKINFDNVGGNSDRTDRLDYLRTTLLFNYFMGSNEMTIRPKLFVGPYAGFLLNSQYKFEGGDYQDYSDNAFNGIDFGVSFGAGLHLKVAEKIWLTPDIRYNLGLVNVADASNITGRNGALGINIGLTFPLN